MPPARCRVAQAQSLTQSSRKASTWLRRSIIDLILQAKAATDRAKVSRQAHGSTLRIPCTRVCPKSIRFSALIRPINGLKPLDFALEVSAIAQRRALPLSSATSALACWSRRHSGATFGSGAGECSHGVRAKVGIHASWRPQSTRCLQTHGCLRPNFAVPDRHTLRNSSHLNKPSQSQRNSSAKLNQVLPTLPRTTLSSPNKRFQQVLKLFSDSSHRASGQSTKKFLRAPIPLVHD